MCQVATLGWDTLLLFWNLEDGHQRRVLVDDRGLAWLDVGDRAVAVAPGNKYAEPVSKILAARAN